MWNSPTELLLADEIVSPASKAIDQLLKVAEYAQAGIPRYWTVARDPQNTVTLFRLGSNDTYETAGQMPLDDLLEQSAKDHLA